MNEEKDEIEFSYEDRFLDELSGNPIIADLD